MLPIQLASNEKKVEKQYKIQKVIHPSLARRTRRGGEVVARLPAIEKVYNLFGDETMENPTEKIT